MNITLNDNTSNINSKPQSPSFPSILTNLTQKYLTNSPFSPYLPLYPDKNSFSLDNFLSYLDKTITHLISTLTVTETNISNLKVLNHKLLQREHFLLETISQKENTISIQIQTITELLARNNNNNININFNSSPISVLNESTSISKKSIINEKYIIEISSLKEQNNKYFNLIKSTLCELKSINEILNQAIVDNFPKNSMEIEWMEKESNYRLNLIKTSTLSLVKTIENTHFNSNILINVINKIIEIIPKLSHEIDKDIMKLIDEMKFNVKQNIDNNIDILNPLNLNAGNVPAYKELERKIEENSLCMNEIKQYVNSI
jgi:hypothetical protein